MLHTFAICLSLFELSGQSLTSTYIGGTLGTKLNVYDNSCSGIIGLQLPENDFYIVTGVDVSYSFRSVSPFSTSQQRSFLEFLNNGSSEPEVSGPPVQFQNPLPYSRSGLDIANGTYPGGTNLQFALRIKSEDLTDLSVTECNNLRHYVEDASWTITVHYTQGPKVGINTDAPEALLDVNGKIMISDDAYSAREGMVKYDAMSKEFSGYNGSEWKSLSKAGVVEDLDGDTKITLEASPGSDEDEITLLFDGLERWKFFDNRIEQLLSGGNLFMGKGIGGTQLGSDNTVYGNQAFVSNAGGVSNVAIGKESMSSNTSGYENTAMGKQSLLFNTGGYQNTAVGFQSLSSNTEGFRNVGIGSLALSGNEDGIDNIGIGVRTLAVLNDGIGNIGIGYNAGSKIVGQNYNTVIGHRAFLDAAGAHNTIIGSFTRSRFLLQNMDSTTIVGYDARGSDASVSLGAGSSSSFRCMALGSQSDASEESIAIGRRTDAKGFSVLIGNGSSVETLSTPARAVGLGNNVKTGWYSVTIGSGASTANAKKSVAIGRNSDSGSESVSVGYLADATTDAVAIGESAISQNSGVAIGRESDAGSNAVAIGETVNAGDNEVRIGKSSVTSIGGPQAWTNLSDKRYKKSIRGNVPGLDFISLLEPITYQLNTELLRAENGSDSDFSETASMNYSGFLAQDVEKAALSLGYDFYGVDRPQERGGKYGLRYAIFVVPLVKAVQEQQQIIEIQKQKITSLEKRLDAIEERINQEGQ